MPTAKPTAIDRLQGSNLATPKQLELMGGDVDLSKFKLQMRDAGGIQLESVITEAVVDRTIDGASTLIVTVDDDEDRKIQLSGRLGRKVDVNVDGLWWTFVGAKKTGRKLVLTFEEREVNLLRYYTKFMVVSRDEVTRAEFVLRLIKEVKEVHLKWVIPELHIKQAILGIAPGPNQILVDGTGNPVAPGTTDPTQDAITRNKGIINDGNLTVKGATADQEQIKNGEIVLQTGEQMRAPEIVLVAGVVTGITESQLRNLPGGDRDSRGVFQQRPSQDWPASGNVATDATAFYQRAIKLYQNQPGLTVAQICQGVQHSAFMDGSNYASWENEGRVWVRAFHGGDLSSAGGLDLQAAQVDAQQNYFSRGTIQQAGTAYLLTKENSWNCMTRLANEVQWRAFCVSGTIYFVSEKWLFSSKPFMVISEDTPGVDWIDYDFDEGKLTGTVTVTAHMTRWAAPPGSIVRIVNMGIIDGNWLVNDVSRSLYDTVGTITLKKPEPVLPEPVAISGLPKSVTPPVGGASSTTPEISITQGNNIQKKVVAFAQSQLGLPYRWGGESPGHFFDCSGLTQAAYDSAGLKIPRTSQTQWTFGRQLNKVELLQPGDLVFFAGSDGSMDAPGHVGIYIGNGNMIDAPHTGAFVRVDKNFRNQSDYVGATRPWQR